MSDFQRQPRKKNPLDEFKLKLTANPVMDSNKRPSLAMSVYKNNPRIDVYTNVDSDRDNGPIRAAMDSLIFFALMQKIREVAEHQGEIKYAIDNENFIFPGGKRSDRPVLVSTTHVGKDDKGRIYLAVTAKDRPKVKFYFEGNQWFTFRKADGSVLEEAEVSRTMALAYASVMERLVPQILQDEFVPYEPKPKPNGGGNGGGYQQQGGGRPPSEDDMPF